MSPARTPIPEGRRAAIRDAAIARVRRATTATLALATALVAAFAGLAATSTHSRKVVRHATTKGSNTTATVQTPSVSPPPLQPSGSSTPAPPAQTPTPSSSPPAAVSGGS